MNRREAIKTAGAAVALPALQAAAANAPAAKRKTIAMLVYPNFTALDLVGPHHVFSALEGYEVQLVGRTTELVTSDMRLTVKPTLAIQDCPEELAVLFVPGGTNGTVKMMGDADVLSFLKSRGEKSDYVTSVCTGSLILAAAGLLRGLQGDQPLGGPRHSEALGAEPVEERVVIDRNRVTGGGVTAGIDFALTLAAKLKDEPHAKAVQLVMEYAPEPPFQAGTPAEAGDELTNQQRKRFAAFVKLATAAAEKAKSGW